jgi:hypothetical protein
MAAADSVNRYFGMEFSFDGRESGTGKFPKELDRLENLMVFGDQLELLVTN